MENILNQFLFILCFSSTYFTICLKVMDFFFKYNLFEITKPNKINNDFLALSNSEAIIISPQIQKCHFAICINKSGSKQGPCITFGCYFLFIKSRTLYPSILLLIFFYTIGLQTLDHCLFHFTTFWHCLIFCFLMGYLSCFSSSCRLN